MGHDQKVPPGAAPQMSEGADGDSPMYTYYQQLMPPTEKYAIPGGDSMERGMEDVMQDPGMQDHDGMQDSMHQSGHNSDSSDQFGSRMG